LIDKEESINIDNITTVAMLSSDSLTERLEGTKRLKTDRL